jgi:hypothetical protein
MLNKIYLYLGGTIVLCYALMAFMGWELGDEPRDKFDPNHPGGIRHSHFWIMGYRGGK